MGMKPFRDNLARQNYERGKEKGAQWLRTHTEEQGRTASEEIEKRKVRYVILNDPLMLAYLHGILDVLPVKEKESVGQGAEVST